MSERWNGDRESKAKDFECRKASNTFNIRRMDGIYRRKAASTFITRRMDGIYRKDEEVIDTLTEEVKELFDPE